MSNGTDETTPSLLEMPCWLERMIRSSPMPDRHMMIDIETLDVTHDAAIVAIGAVTFNPRAEGIEGEETFKLTIDQRSNEIHGRSVSESTLAWWGQQPAEAQDATFGGPHVELSTALRKFTEWINELRPTCTRVWAKDPDFDVVILRHACGELGIRWPFNFWESRSCRTAMEMSYPEGDFPSMLMDGPKHDALADAKVQCLEIQHAYYVLGC